MKGFSQLPMKLKADSLSLELTRKNAVDFILDGCPIKKVAALYGTTVRSCYRWLKQYTNNPQGGLKTRLRTSKISPVMYNDLKEKIRSIQLTERRFINAKELRIMLQNQPIKIRLSRSHSYRLLKRLTS